MAEKGVRIPPNNIDAEKSVLGAVLVSPDTLMAVVDPVSYTHLIGVPSVRWTEAAGRRHRPLQNHHSW